MSNARLATFGMLAGIVAISVIILLFMYAHGGNTGVSVVRRPAWAPTGFIPEVFATITTSTPAKFLCPSIEYDYDCYMRYYRDLVKSEGIPSAVSDVMHRSKDSEDPITYCHLLMHLVGTASVQNEENPSNFVSDAALTSQNSNCWGGFYHGVFEELARQYGTQSLHTWLNSPACGASGHTKALDSCAHSVGHLVMQSNGADLPPSLHFCDETFSENAVTESCYTGVFMERSFIDIKTPESDTPPFSLCASIDAKYARLCYRSQIVYVYGKVGGDVRKLFSLCGGVRGEVQDACFESIGRHTMISYFSYGRAEAEEVCARGPTEASRMSCYRGAALTLVIKFQSAEPALAFCAHIPSTQTCSDAALSYYKTMYVPK